MLRDSIKMFEIPKGYIIIYIVETISLKIDSQTRCSSLYDGLDRFEKYNNIFLKIYNRQGLRLSNSKLGASKKISGYQRYKSRVLILYKKYEFIRRRNCYQGYSKIINCVKYRDIKIS